RIRAVATVKLADAAALAYRLTDVAALGALLLASGLTTPHGGFSKIEGLRVLDGAHANPDDDRCGKRGVQSSREADQQACQKSSHTISIAGQRGLHLVPEVAQKHGSGALPHLRDCPPCDLSHSLPADPLVPSDFCERTSPASPD